ncbi:pentatricopeptide repeat-containing protein At3g29230-like, partial [Phalaenopsis equestris]|uniref:pentatricopeptide repeat-containing protein At3g29230-like n=1 Tax=Phalaenopsis equestris TaxID=78828 RepID=UPI0009E1A4E3
MIPARMAGDQVHCFALITGLRSNLFVGTSLIEMYAIKVGAGLAYKMFEDMPERNVVVWTAIIRAYIAVGDMKNAFNLFNQLEEHDVIVWGTMISAFIEHGDIATAEELFASMPVRDVQSWNTMLFGYANGDDIGACERFFAIMPVKNVFSWNGLIQGHARHGKFSNVLNIFHQMLISTNIKPNDATLLLVLSSCSKLGALDWGRWIHLYSNNNGFNGNIYIKNGLIDMYAKCGCINSAIDMFSAMEKRDVITWNSMISGLAMHGMGLEALEVFDRMLDNGEKPDGITFVGVLCACVHMGLVERGLQFFRNMTTSYSVAPGIEHYGCMVDLLGRVGLLNDAICFVKEMPMEPDDVIWSALLGACRAWRHIYLAEIAMSRLVRLVPDDAANYVVLSNIYGDVGRWNDVGRLKKVLRRMDVGKSPGCSLIEVNMEVVEFCSLDVRH